MHKVIATIKFETELDTAEELNELSLYIERRLNLRDMDIEVVKEMIDDNLNLQGGKKHNGK